MTFLKFLRLAFLVCAVAALAVATGPVFAHAKLLSEVPAAEDAATVPNATAPIGELRLAFSEGLNGAFSKVLVKDVMGVEVKATVGLDPKDDKTLVVTFAAPLPKGEYLVDWTAVASDGHKTTGTYKVNVAQ